jgi:hypothetical protein
MPENKQSGKQEIQNAGKPAIQQQTSMPDSRVVKPQTTGTEKMTFRFHPEGRYAVEDLKTDLLRQCGIKVSREQIVEEAVLMLSKNFKQYGTDSLLVVRFKHKAESEK